MLKHINKVFTLEANNTILCFQPYEGEETVWQAISPLTALNEDALNFLGQYGFDFSYEYKPGSFLFYGTEEELGARLKAIRAELEADLAAEVEFQRAHAAWLYHDPTIAPTLPRFDEDWDEWDEYAEEG